MARESYAAVLITQGEHKFYQLAMPSDTLGQFTFVSTRDDDPEKGFQRLLNKNRAKEIASYIDSGHGTIPTSVILSAQENCNLEYDSRNKTVRADCHHTRLSSPSRCRRCSQTAAVITPPAVIRPLSMGAVKIWKIAPVDARPACRLAHATSFPLQ